MSESNAFPTHGWVVQYRYPGTVNGEPVGIVYALDINHLSPRAWSYRKTPTDATRFNTREDAEAVMRTKHWPEATAVAV